MFSREKSSKKGGAAKPSAASSSRMYARVLTPIVRVSGQNWNAGDVVCVDKSYGEPLVASGALRRINIESADIAEALRTMDNEQIAEMLTDAHASLDAIVADVIAKKPTDELTEMLVARGADLKSIVAVLFQRSGKSLRDFLNENDIDLRGVLLGEIAKLKGAGVADLLHDAEVDVGALVAAQKSELPEADLLAEVAARNLSGKITTNELMRRDPDKVISALNDAEINLEHLVTAMVAEMPRKTRKRVIAEITDGGGK